MSIIVIKTLLLLSLIASDTQAAPRRGKIQSLCESKLVSRPVSAEERETLEGWGVHAERKNLGTLLTPPRGKIRPQVRRVQKYLVSLIEKLAGPELRARGLTIEINLYAANQANAFQASVDGAEAAPLYRLLGRAADGRTIYEIGVTTGLLKLAKNEDELAMTLGHELGHLFEGHTEPLSVVRKQVERIAQRQSHEVVADFKGLELAVKAGYNPDAAIDSLDGFFRGLKRERVDVEWIAVEHFLQNHHTEGVRLALNQAQAEQISRTTVGVNRGRFTPLPDFVRLKIRGRDFTHEPKIKQMQALLEEVTRKHFLSDAPITWFDTLTFKSAWKKWPVEVQPLRNFTPSATQIGDLLSSITGKFDQASVSPQLRVQAALRLYRFLESNFRHPNKPLELKIDDKVKLTSFFLKNSIGPNGWQAKRFLEALHLDSHSEDYKAIYDDFVQDIMFSRPMQEIVAKLVRTNSEWRKLVEMLPEISMNDDSGGGGPNLGLTYYFRHLTNDPRYAGPMNEAYWKALKHYLKTSVDPVVLAREIDHEGTSSFYFHTLRLIHSKREDLYPSRRSELKEALVSALNEFAKFRIERVVALLESPTPVTPKELEPALKSLLGSDGHLPIGNEEWKRLEAPLLKTMLRFGKSSEEPGKFHPFSTRLGELLTRQLVLKDVSYDDKITVLLFLAAHESSSYSFDKKNNSSDARNLANIQDFITSLGTEKLVKLLSTRYHDQFQENLSNSLSKLFDIVSVDTTDQGLQNMLAEVRTGKIRNDESCSTLGCGEKGDLATDIHLLAEAEKNKQLTLLSFLGASREFQRNIAQRLRFSDLENITDSLKKTKNRREALHALAIQSKYSTWNRSEVLGTDGGSFLLEILMTTQAQAANLSDWYGVASHILSFSPGGLQSRNDAREAIEEYLYPKLKRLPSSELREWLGKEHIAGLLRPSRLAKLMVASLNSSPAARDTAAIGELALEVEALNRDSNFSVKFPEAFRQFRERVAERYRLQPGNLSRVFPETKNTATEYANPLWAHLRGMSALVAFTREHSIEDQLAMIQYLMGRKHEAPKYLVEAASKFEKFAPIFEMVQGLKDRLSKDTVLNRVLVANAFLAGPTSILEKPKGTDKVLDILLGGVRSENQAVARRIAYSLLRAQGKTGSLALAYVLGQHVATETESMLSEGAILRSLFDAYGVPGQKLGQYLGFTAELKEFQDALAPLQDSASPISYYEALRLLQKSFGESWPEGLIILGIKGSGSVNIAIEYWNSETQRAEILSIPRDNIEAATAEDFRRFKLFLEDLTSTPEDQATFGYLKGLAQIIQDSVSLEFDRKSAFEMQRAVLPLYNRNVQEWNVRTVDAYEQRNGGIFMGLAPGKSARVVRETDSKLYASAMEALSQVEFDILLGIGPDGNVRPVPLHANPDFHPGQVLIDAKTSTVTLIDFGQAVHITNAERNFGVDILRIVSGMESSRSALRLITKSFSELGQAPPMIEQSELKRILSSGERMDSFVKLLSLIDAGGAKVPISTVHWVLAMNRQIVLGDQIGLKTTAKVRNLLLTKKITGGTTIYNRLHLWAQDLK